MAASFSSPAEDVLKRRISVVLDTSVPRHPTTDEDIAVLETVYDIEWTASELRKGGYKQVALQFPDELLHLSVPIYQSLKRRLGDDVGVYVLADTSYGNCCVDEVAAQHIDGDVVVHYGYSCLSRPSRLPVLYVLSKKPLDVQAVAQSLLTLYRQEYGDMDVSHPAHNFILIPDVAYAHVVDALGEAIVASPLFPPNSRIFYNQVPKRDDPMPSPSTKALAETSYIKTSSSSGVPIFSSTAQPRTYRRYTLPPSVPLESCTILYVGPESLGLTNLLMTHPENKVISYDPASDHASAKVESTRTNRLLMRRYAVVQRARDADVIGILVGTLGVASYLPLLSYLRTIIRAHRKKTYTLSVGKLSPSKLANFAEIECFVLVACPENSVIDAKDFLRPIVTPFELLLSLGKEPSWPGRYVLDFDHVIEDPVMKQATTGGDDTLEGNEPDLDRPTFSLVTGKYRHARRYGEGQPLSQNPSEPSGVVLRNTDNALVKLPDSAGAEFLRQRTFKGLEQRLGQDKPSVLEQGRSGVPKEYQDDHKPQGDI